MKNQYSKGMKNFKRIIFAAGLSFISQTSLFAQDNAMFDVMDDKSKFVLNEQIINGSSKYINKKGDEVKSNPIYKLSLDERVKKGITSVVKSNPKLSNKNQTSTTFTVTFLDVANATGYGFDDPTAGATRRATIEQAVAYYANIITNTGSADIEIQESENISGYALAWGGQYYFSTPGFQNGTVWRHIITGVDPSSTLADGLVTYNFYYTFNDDYNRLPTSSEYDLYTVSIHELGHAFGFTSMSNSDGSSQISSGVYSSYDEYLQSDNYSDLFTTTGGQNSAATFSSSSSELATDGVVFDFGNGSYGAVYSPNPFNSSSLDHFDSNRLTDGTKYLMHPSLSKGVVVREMHEQEAKVLEQIGYSINFNNISTSTVNNHISNANNVAMFPNPIVTGNNLNLIVTTEKEQNITTVIYDVLGNVIYKQNNLVSQSSPSVQLPINNSIASGTYFVQVQGDVVSQKQMLIIE